MLRVTAIVPTIGRKDFLVETIQSLLNQTLPFDEILVYDNSMQQNVAEIISEHIDISNIVIKKSGKQLKPTDSWNNAVTHSSNEYIVFFGDDDTAEPIVHETLQKYIDKHSLILLSFNRINEKGNLIIPSSNLNESVYDGVTFIKKRINQEIDMVLPGILFKKEHFILASGFIECYIPNFLYLDDLLWFKLAILNKTILITKEVAWNYRVHSSQIGHNVNLFEFNKAVPLFVDKVESEIQRVKGDTNFNLSTAVGINKQEYIDRLILTRYQITTHKISLSYKKIKCITAVLLSSLSFSKKRTLLKSLIKSLVKQ